MGKGSNPGFGLNSSVLHHISYINTSNHAELVRTPFKLSTSVCLLVIATEVYINSVPKKNYVSNLMLIFPVNCTLVILF